MASWFLCLLIVCASSFSVNEAKAVQLKDIKFDALEKFNLGEEFPVRTQIEAIFSEVINFIMDVKYMVVNLVQQTSENQEELDIVRESITKEVVNGLKNSKGDAKIVLKKLSPVTIALIEKKAQQLQMGMDEIVNLIAENDQN